MQMKYCKNCGTQMVDEAVVCPNCGRAVEDNIQPQPQQQQTETSTIKTVAKVFMILGCIATAWALIPMCWTIPMTVHYCRAIKEHKHVSTGFKVCSLLFVNLIGGIAMLCDDKD